ncbi:MAG: GNAT family N-acetyltransferase [Chlamydiales bacterium]
MFKKDQMPPGLEVRYTEPGDGAYLKQWLSDPEGGNWFPIDGEIEVDDAVVRWIAFCRYQCSITLLKDGVPCGIATLYLQPYVKLAHQCEFGIVLGKAHRRQKLGSFLMACVMHLAKEKFKIELLHLQVYAGNPAIHLYRKFGFKEFGRQESWIKEKNGYFARIFMERYL